MRDASRPLLAGVVAVMLVGCSTPRVSQLGAGLAPAKLNEAAQVVGIVSGAVGLGRAMASMAQLLAGAAVQSGGLTYALAGAAGGGAGAAAASASIQGVLKGLAVAGMAGTLTYRMGGVGPVNAGKEGELRAGVTG